MDLSPKKRDRIRGFQRLGFQLRAPVIAFVFACASLLVSLSESERIMIAGISLRQIAFLCAFASAAFQLYCSIRKCITKRDYLIMCQQEELSKAMVKLLVFTEIYLIYSAKTIKEHSVTTSGKATLHFKLTCKNTTFQWLRH